MAGDRRISRPDASLPDWEVPDSAYRPIPIVWFTGALMVQITLQIVAAIIFLLVLGLPSLAVVAFALLITGMIGHWTWERGMAQASFAWRTATIVMLVLSVGIAALGILT